MRLTRALQQIGSPARSQKAQRAPRHRATRLHRATTEALEPRLLLSTSYAPTSSEPLPLTPSQQPVINVLTNPSFYAITHPRIYSIPAPPLPVWASDRAASITRNLEAQSFAAPAFAQPPGVPAMSAGFSHASSMDTFPTGGDGGSLTNTSSLGTLYVGDAAHDDNFVSTDSASDSPTLYCDAHGVSDGDYLMLFSDAAYDFPSTAATMLWQIDTADGDLVDQGDFSDGAGGAATPTPYIPAGTLGTQYFTVVAGIDYNNDGTLDPDEISFTVNVEAVDFTAVTANDQDVPITVYAAPGGTAAVSLNAAINPDDSNARTWITYELYNLDSEDAAGTGNFGSSNPATLTLSPGSYIGYVGFDGDLDQSVSITVVAPPILKTLSLSQDGGGPGITIATTSNPTTTLYMNLPDSGPLAFDLATTTAGTMLDPAIVRWKVTGAGATPGTGTNAGTVSVDGSTAGNWTYTVTAWIDQNNNNQIDSGESQLQGSVTVVQPKFTLTDTVSWNSVSDTTNILSTPTGIFAVSNDGPNSTLQLALTNLLPSGPLPERYDYNIESASGASVSGGPLDSNSFITVPTPGSGQYVAYVTDETDPNFSRAIPFYVLTFHILWNGSDMTGVGNAPEVNYGDILSSTGRVDASNGSQSSFINLLTGQQLSLKTDFATECGVGANSYQWDLGTTSTFISNYVLAGAASAPTSATVVPIVAGDLSGATMSAYETADIPNQPISLTVNATIPGVGPLDFTLTTEINFQKPGQSIYNTPGVFQVSGTQSMPILNSTSLFDQMSYSIATGPWAVGTVSYVQLVNFDHTYTDSSGHFHELASGTTPELDASYPYSSGLGSADYPSEPLGILRVQVSANDSFQTWLMWTPPGDSSIPVPIQEFSWGWGAGASWGWYFVGGIDPDPAPGATTVPVVSSNTTQYPTWTAVFKVHLY